MGGSLNSLPEYQNNEKGGGGETLVMSYRL